MPIILAITAATVLVSIALLTLTLRGKRVGTEPRCRKCNYDLTGIATHRANTSEPTNNTTKAAQATPLTNTTESASTSTSTTTTTTNAQGSRSLGDPSNSNHNHQNKTTNEHEHTATTHCPECRHPFFDSKGNPSTRTGSRRRKPVLVGAAAVVAVLSLAALSLAVWMNRSNQPWIQTAPTWLVIQAAKFDVQGAPAEILHRLPDRFHFVGPSPAQYTGKPLSDKQITDAVNALISAQRRANPDWSIQWAQLAGALISYPQHWTEQQVVDYASNANTITINAPTNIDPEHEFSFRIAIRDSATAPHRPAFNDTATFMLHLDPIVFTLDTKDATPTEHHVFQSMYLQHDGLNVSTTIRFFLKDLVQEPKPGKYSGTATTTLRFSTTAQATSEERINHQIPLTIPFTFTAIEPGQPTTTLLTADQAPILMQTLTAGAIRIGTAPTGPAFSFGMKLEPQTQSLDALLVGTFRIIINGEHIALLNPHATPFRTVPTTSSLGFGVGGFYPVLDGPEGPQAATLTIENLYQKLSQLDPAEHTNHRFDVIYIPDPSLAQRHAPEAPAILNQQLIFKQVPVVIDMNMPPTGEGIPPTPHHENRE